MPLDPNDLTRFAGPPKHLFAFNKDHVWERYGEMNEYTDVAWIEGPWLQKYNGTYYLEYSASGTQWKTYADGYYTAKSPLGPFTYAPNNPLLRKTDGLVTGPGHGSIVEGPDKHLWQFYTIVLCNPPGGRRIGMDPVAFDKDGNFRPRHRYAAVGAGRRRRHRQGRHSGSIPVTINKLRAMNALSAFSSQQPGHDAAYAVDNSTGTWWSRSPTDAQPTLTIELSPATRFDRVQLFTIDSVRLLFTGGGRGGMGGRGFAGRGGTRGAGPAAPDTAATAVTNTTPAPATAGAPGLPSTNSYQYKIDVSADGTSTQRHWTKARTPLSAIRFSRKSRRQMPLCPADDDQLAAGDAAGDHRVHGLRQAGGIVAGGRADSRGALRGARTRTKLEAPKKTLKIAYCTVRG